MKKKYILKYILPIILLPSLILLGCNGRGSMYSDAPETEIRMNPTESVYVAAWQEIDLDLTAANMTQVIGDTIYSAVWEGDYDVNGNYTKNNARISRLQNGDKEAEEILILEDERQLIHFMVDEEKSVYLLYMEPLEGENYYFLQKMDGIGNIVYCERVPLEQNEPHIFERISSGIAGSEGSVFFSVNDGIAYLFDNSGRLSGRGDWREIALDSNKTTGLVNAENEIYLYHADKDEVILRSIDMTSASLGAEKILLNNEMSPEEALSIGGGTVVEEAPFSRMKVYSGYQKGVIISTADALWKYSPGTEEKEILFYWSDKHINLRWSYIREMGVLTGGGIYVLFYDSYTGGTVQVLIQEKSKSEVAESNTIVIGYIEIPNNLPDWADPNASLKELVAEFNKAYTGYLVEMRGYESGEYRNDFYMDLLQGKGPDIFDLQSLQKENLMAKGVLEDLGPYFEASEVVKESDLLPRVRDAGYIGDKMVCVMPSFLLQAIMVEKGYVENGGWTGEEFWALAEKYPNGSYLIPSYSPEAALISIMPAEVESYINWEERKCSFDSDSFMKLLEEMKKNWDNNRYPGLYIADSDEKVRAFHNKDVLVLYEIISNLEQYLDIKEPYLENDGELVGYPNPEGKPWYQMFITEKVYGINSASDCKEGAWKFLEFMLSWEYQSGNKDFFPVRSDAFEAWLEKGPTVRSENRAEFTDADRELIRFMVDNAYWEEIFASIIASIMWDELPPFFAGDKTAKEVAEIIQNRALLYLNE